MNQTHNWDDRGIVFSKLAIGPICILLSIESLGNARFSSHAPYRKELLEGRTWLTIAVRVDDSAAPSRHACTINLDDDKWKSAAIRLSANPTKPSQKIKKWRHLSESKGMKKHIKRERFTEPYYKMKDQKSPSKNERSAKLSQKVEGDTVFKRLKDGQNYPSKRNVPLKPQNNKNEQKSIQSA
jgi:hypothetical protein